MANDTVTSELKKTWELAAPGWAKWEHIFSQAFAEATGDLLDMAQVGPGMRVLDIASGAGSQSIEAAKRVGPDGSVLATDISGTMLEHLRQNASEAGINNIETHMAAADELDVSLGPFDAAICRMGLMLFPSPKRALVALRPLLRPGARSTTKCQHHHDRSQWRFCYDTQVRRRQSQEARVSLLWAPKVSSRGL